jgi:hypothetical protein
VTRFAVSAVTIVVREVSKAVSGFGLAARAGVAFFLGRWGVDGCGVFGPCAGCRVRTVMLDADDGMGVEGCAALLASRSRVERARVDIAATAGLALVVWCR